MKDQAKRHRFTTLSSDDLEVISGGAGNAQQLMQLRRLEILESQNAQKAREDFQRILKEQGGKTSELEDNSFVNGGGDTRLGSAESNSGWDWWSSGSEGESFSNSSYADAGDSWFGDSSDGWSGGWSDV